MQDICGFKAELPLGVRLDASGPRAREFSVIKSGWVTQKLMLDENLRTAHQHEWQARVIASVVESIGGQPVYKPFSKSDFDKIPPVVLKLPLSDIRYVLALAHMHTYGSEIDGGKQKCSLCLRHDLLKLDLRSMKIEESKHEDVDAFPVMLPTGFREDEPDERKRLPYHGKTWNRLTLRPATLEDAIRHAKYLTPQHLVTFELRLYTDCIMGVESWAVNEAGEQTTKLDEMDRNTINLKGYNLLMELDSRDHLAIRRAEAGLPQARLIVERRCSNCGEDVETPIQTSSFFPMA